MTSSMPDKGIEIVPGRMASASIGEAGVFDDSLSVNWPTDHNEREIVQFLVDAAIGDEDAVDVKHDLVVNDMAFLSVQQFMEIEQPVLKDGGGIIRFNYGIMSDGGSVTAVMDDNGYTELQGVFSPNNVELATRIVADTIIVAGQDRANEVIQLAHGL